jgi:hypothetical protein
MTGIRKAVVVSTPGYGASGTAGAVEEDLVSMSGLSLAELANLDDLAIAGALGELLERRRCGVGPSERYAATKDSGGLNRCGITSAG